MNFENKRKDSFLSKFPSISLDDDSTDLTGRCKFNFSYFDDSQSAGQKFEDWDHNQLVKLTNKLKEYSRNSLKFWQSQYIGTGKHRYSVLSIYGDFPKKSDFVHPKHIPHQVRWGRFRLEYSVRLIGFVIPEEYCGAIHRITKSPYDCNTFYIVFLDKDHCFYKR